LEIMEDHITTLILMLKTNRGHLILNPPFQNQDITHSVTKECRACYLLQESMPSLLVHRIAKDCEDHQYASVVVLLISLRRMVGIHQMWRKPMGNNITVSHVIKNLSRKMIKKAHFKQHVKCEVESCNFVASRKAIKLHYIQNHEVGKFKIVLKNDEDIEKWREDRRKNYPSAAVKSEKITMEEVRKCHGNVLKKRSFSYKGNGKWKRGNFSQSQRCVLQKTDNNIENRMINGEKADVKNLDHSCKENETIELSMSCLEEKPEMVARNGLETLKQLYDSSENDDSSDDENDSIEESADTVLCSSFSTFASKENKKEQLNLNTSCNFPKEIDDTVEIKHNDAKVIRHRGGAEVCMGGFLDSNREKLQVESGIESCMVKKTPIEHKTKLLDGKSMEGINENKTLGSNRKKKWIDKDDRKNRNHGRICQRHRPTLLEMLLAKDIKHERNIILQCIRFVKEKNFFIMDLK